MVVGLLTVELYVRGSVSLKDKRRVVQSLVGRIRGRFNVSVAEVSHQVSHQRATIAVACVGSSSAVVRGTLESVGRLCAGHGDAEVAGQALEML